ncbi:uncharacterized protein [Penaeus vannamei]|uniref:uncharacterized protein isoform X1 n=1 Tax=Penaeus vannamei TaxID=6689 RepID=UPI00387F6442
MKYELWQGSVERGGVRGEKEWRNKQRGEALDLRRDFATISSTPPLSPPGRPQPLFQAKARLGILRVSLPDAPTPRRPASKLRDRTDRPGAGGFFTWTSPDILKVVRAYEGVTKRGRQRNTREREKERAGEGKRTAPRIREDKGEGGGSG